MEIGELAIGNKTETICFTWDSYDEMFDTDVWNVWHRPVPDYCLCPCQGPWGST